MVLSSKLDRYDSFGSLRPVQEVASLGHNRIAFEVCSSFHPLVERRRIQEGTKAAATEDAFLVDHDAALKKCNRLLLARSESLNEKDLLANTRSRYGVDLDSVAGSSMSSFLSISSSHLSHSTLEEYSSSNLLDFDEVDYEDVSDRTIGMDGSESDSVREKLATVRFGHVSVREYTVTLGCLDDTACPLQLSWDYREKAWPTIAVYNASRISKRLHRIPVHERRLWIASAHGIPVSDVKYLEAEASTEEDTALHSTANSDARAPNTVFDSPPRKPRVRRGTSFDPNGQTLFPKPSISCLQHPVEFKADGLDTAPRMPELKRGCSLLGSNR